MMDGVVFWQIMKVNVTRLCRQKSILAVNGQFPGPTIYARKGDVVVVNVYNRGDKNITIHWHGVDQPRNPWSDGPEYITQCPIQPGAGFPYRVILSEEEGTLWWHAHSGFDRATVHGAIVIHPKRGTTFPFPFPFPFPFKKKPRAHLEEEEEEIPLIILGEWWRDDDPTQLLEEAKRTGRDVKPSDAITINGQPGDLFPCSRAGTFKVSVEHGKTYLLRVINAGLTNDMFFAVAGHRLTVVATDARYTKPFTVDHVMVASGQTVDVLLEAHRTTGRYYMAARTFVSSTKADFNNSTATAILEYTDAEKGRPPVFPINLPAVYNMDAATAYTARLRSLGSKDHPVDVPAHVDERMLVAMAVNLIACAPNATCSGPYGDRLAASLNNVSFENPSAVDILHAYYRHRSTRGVYEANFPDEPPFLFNFTEPATGLGRFTKRGTKVKVLEYGAAVEVVFQDTDILGTESHPMHLHGFGFYVVGRGFGSFNEYKDPATYNLVDPPRQNTVSVPKAGWAAIRFRAENPGVWFMHCHFDRHMLWGMDTVFIVKDGKTSGARMTRPPRNMPKC
ncbi:putative laccase-9 [Phragmites australis]|uniref:putative laccase-9 n=1 Tax=Phragmites australis TaxID=29695 RepID=UPI002D78C888|nr:putative laccase-9 [Phragmites australis]